LEENAMKFISKIQKKETRRLPMTGKVKKGFRYYCMAVLTLTAVFAMSTTAFAAGGDPLTVVNNLSDFIFGFIRAIGLILLGFGIVQVGLSLKSHDPSQRANGFLTLAGGIIIVFAKEILTLITG
jgi:trbC/VIRB2 family